MSEEIAKKQFDELAAAGLVSEYVKLKQGVVYPLFTLDTLGDWPKRGTKMRFLNKNGYDYQKEEARECFIPNFNTLTVLKTSIGGSSSTYTFAEVPGRWNTVMFETLLKLDDYPSVKRVFLDIAYCNNMINREESEEELLSDASDFLNFRTRICAADLKILDEWLETLTEEEFEHLADGDEKEMIEVVSRSPSYRMTSHGDKLTDIFDEWFDPELTALEK
jgi:hypothetical protein